MRRIVIIGNGVSGITAARNIRKLSQNQITVISAETDHFFARTALMYVFMGHMKFEHIKPYEDWFWEKNKIDLVRAYVESIDTQRKVIQLSGGATINYDSLILALGSVTNKLGWPGQDLEGVQGLYSVQDLELMEKNVNGIKKAIIVGGGLIGVEMAEMLKSRGIDDVTFLIRERGYWQNILPLEESEFIGAHMRQHGITLHLNTELSKIIGDEKGHVNQVETTNGLKIDCQFVGITTGVKPNLKLVRGSPIETNRGILVDEYLQTSVLDIFAIGDCSEIRSPVPGRLPIEPIWYTGRLMGEVVAHTVTGRKTAYRPGKWYNSAKFFDIEYQTYGNVGPELNENENHFYWEDDSGKRSLKLVFDKETKILHGLNAFGIRLKHDVCDRWLNENRTIFQVMKDLSSANFDPEFHEDYTDEIIKEFNQMGFGQEIVNKNNKARIWKLIGI